MKVLVASKSLSEQEKLKVLEAFKGIDVEIVFEEKATKDTFVITRDSFFDLDKIYNSVNVLDDKTLAPINKPWYRKFDKKKY